MDRYRNRRGTSIWSRWSAALLTVLTVAFTGAPVDAQTGQITGVVRDAQSNAPISDVQVYVVGLQLGSLSRATGQYLILNVPVGQHTLRAERIGYEPQEVTVDVTDGGTAIVNITLGSQALGLDEIVVTGAAGAARRREIGNSISEVNVADVMDRPTSTTTLLQGSAPGLEITGNDGQAGQGKQIRLRGNGSVSMTNQPLIFVDGVRLMDGAFPAVTTPGTVRGRGAFVTVSPLDNINPNDIERIEIIKGAAATTLYGTEASAGVIQIFTKRGSSGAPVWTAEIQQGTGWARKFGVNGVDYLNMEHFMRDAWWGGGYEGGDLSRDCVTDDARWEGVNGDVAGACSWPGSQWYQTYNVSVRGGGQSLQYFVSGAYQDDQYMLPLDQLEKYNFQGNFTFSPANNLSVQWNTGYMNQWQQNTPSGNNLSGLELQTFRQERNYFSDGDPRTIATVLDYDFQQRLERLTSGITLNYNPITNVTNRLTVGYDFAQQEARNLMPFGFWEFPDGSLVTDVFQKRLLTFDYVGSYRFPLTDAVQSTFSWGGQAIGNDLRQVTALGQTFPGAAEPTLSSASIFRNEEDRESVWNAGFFFQNVFDIADRYFITAGLRVDGNSAFGDSFGLQTYPKISGSWVISDESFWPESMGSMKIRTAYGQSGRAPGAFDAVRTWDPVGLAGAPAFRPDNLGNPDLGPEITEEIEVGFDGSWINDRLSVAFTYYTQKTRDALLSVSGLPSQGFTEDQLRNVGELSNNGIEVQVNADVLQANSWGADLGLSLSTNHSEVVSLGGIEQFEDLNGWIIEGQPVPVGFDRRVANPDQVSGSWEYENGGENVVVGPLLPTHIISPTLNVRVPGNIILSARGEYRGGHFMEVNEISISRSVRSPLCFPYYVDPATDITLRDDTPDLWRERCTPSGGDDYWFDADYFRLRAVSATIPVDFAFPDRISNATLTLAVNNIWDWFREIPWYDPEVLSNDAATDDGIGAQSERTPAPATFRASLRVTF